MRRVASWSLIHVFLISDGASGLRSRHQHSDQKYSYGNQQNGRRTNDIVEDVAKPAKVDLEPSFDVSNPKNTTVQLGGTAYLPCTVHNLGNKTVSR